MRAHAEFCRNPLHPGPCAKPKSWTARHHRRHREAVPVTGDQRHTVESAKSLSDDDVLRHTAEIKAQRKGLDKNSQEHKDLLKQEHVLMREKYRRQREGTWGQNAAPSAPAPAKKATKAAPQPPAPPPAPAPAPAGTTPRPANAATVREAQRQFNARVRATPVTPRDTLNQVPSRALQREVGNARNLRSNTSERVQDAAENYRAYDYARINQMLRSGSGGNAALRRDTNTLTQAINASPLQREVTLHRGLSDGSRVFGQSFDGNLAGLEFTDRGFTSTSANARAIQHFLRGGTNGGTANPANAPHPTQLRILAPQGTGALQLSEARSDISEAEVLLQPNSRFRVVNDRGVDANGIRQLDVEVVTPGSSTTPSTPAAPAAPAKAVKKAQPVKRVATVPAPTAPAPTSPRPPVKSTPTPTPAKATPRKQVAPPRNNRFPQRQAADITGRLTELRVNPEAARSMQRVNDEFHAQYNFSFNTVERSSVASSDTNVIAYVRNGNVLGVNARQLNNDRMFQRDERTGWGAPGTASAQGAMVHEMGHYLTENHPEYSYRSGAGQNVWFDAIAAARGSHDFPTNGAGSRPMTLREAVGSFSRYGVTDQHEAEAELFAFYHMGGARRPQWVVSWGEAWHRGHGLDPSPLSERL